MQVIVTQAGERIRTTLAAFIADNDFDSGTVARIEATLSNGRMYRAGGGAEAPWTVEPDRLAPKRTARQQVIDGIIAGAHVARGHGDNALATELDAIATELARYWKLQVSYGRPAARAETAMQAGG